MSIEIIRLEYKFLIREMQLLTDIVLQIMQKSKGMMNFNDYLAKLFTLGAKLDKHDLENIDGETMKTCIEESHKELEEIVKIQKEIISKYIKERE